MNKENIIDYVVQTPHNPNKKVLDDMLETLIEENGGGNTSVSEHNISTVAHNDIRLLIEGLTTRLNALANSDDTTLDQMAEVVAYIKSNRTLIESITTGKVSVANIVNNLTTNVSNKPLSAAQGVVLKGLIDALQTAVNGIKVPTKTSELTNDSGFLTSVPTEYVTETELTAKGYAKQTDVNNLSKEIADLTTNVPSLNTGIAIPKDSDLNTYIKIGNFKCTNSSIVKTFLNCPTQQSFKMIVGYDALFNPGTYKYQEILDLNGDEYWRYTYDDGKNWSSWRHRFDDYMHIPTANGGFGADISFDIGEAEHLKRVEDFVAEMNRLAQNIGMTNTTIKTPSGYCRKSVNETKNALNKSYNSYMTAKDALKLLIAARHTPTVLKAMGTEQHSFKVDYDTNGNVLHSILYNSAWKEWASSNGYTIVGAKGGSFTGSYGEIGSNGILNLTILIKDSNGNNYGVVVLGLQRTEIDTLRTLIVDLINMVNGSTATDVITEASTRTDYPVCMAVVKLTESGTFEDDIAMLENGVFYNENEVRVACSVTKLLTAITVVSRMNNQYVSFNNDDFVGGSGLTGIEVGTVLSTYDALYVMLLASDNNIATLLARVYGN